MIEDYATIFNKKKLFLRFNGLQKAFIDELKGKKIVGKVVERENLFYHYFNEFKYHLFSAYYFIEQLEQLEKAIMDHYNGLKPLIEFQNEVKIDYDSFIVHEYLLRIMPFLNTMFILQDRLMILIALFLDINIKESIQKINESDKDYKIRINNFKKKRYSFTSYATNYFNILRGFPDELGKLIIEYWKLNGQELRKYRNLEQHQYNLLEEAYIVRKPIERFILYLPDNPNERDYKKINYENKRIAVDYFKTEINIFHNFVEKMMKVIGVEPEVYLFGSSLSSKSNLISDYNEGDLLKIWILKNDAILFSVGEKTPDSSAAKINIRKIENKMNALRWEIK